MFNGRDIVIATMHGKEMVIAPLLQKELGVIAQIPPMFDTDRYGTFTGEIARNLDVLAVARQKCIAAMELTGCSLAVASEGSFGPHPQLFFTGCDDELMLFIDREDDLEIFCRNISLHTNFGREEVSTEESLMAFAKKTKFPSHKLILRATKEHQTKFIKGIDTWEGLLANYRNLKGSKIEAETDMRAMNNPSRMMVIEQTTRKLVEKIKRCCPHCQIPGFDVVAIEPGLPCEICHQPTESALAHVLGCKKCGFEQRNLYPRGLKVEEATYCQYCNP
ncbi:hypothetical protein MUY27_07675 [Mucilaginibacter sp. RS28]|uniref:DUF6671 domain-containing protein n=1 Tax=Mucilaginibacter straminoryzae TaxID=2932774 RepID=A0A9X1X6I4_9SPHI|nr:DUF6671 family protein [Mucilaginibacter straminoryzae]MCJ8209584.1 hypothetical protein [Mucilaginibacter straminoryzae]